LESSHRSKRREHTILFWQRNHTISIERARRKRHSIGLGHLSALK
jgi:hypothetical protein